MLVFWMVLDAHCCASRGRRTSGGELAQTMQSLSRVDCFNRIAGAASSGTLAFMYTSDWWDGAGDKGEVVVGWRAEILEKY